MMKLAIDKRFIDSLNKSKGGQLKVELDEVRAVYKRLNNPSCRVLIMNNMCFVLFKELPNVELAVENYKNSKDLEFIDKSLMDLVDVSNRDGNYFLFLVDEFFQGKSLLNRVNRFTRIIIPLVLFNLLGYFYADKASIREVFSGLLTAVSIFIAIFSLFVTSHDYIARKKLALFEKGQLSYYFAVDKYITQTGVVAIIVSVFGLVVTSQDVTGRLYEVGILNTIIIIMLNMVYVAVFLILRSLIEFYIVRPGKFIMGDMKMESERNYWKNKE